MKLKKSVKNAVRKTVGIALIGVSIFLDIRQLRNLKQKNILQQYQMTYKRLQQMKKQTGKM